MSAERDPGEREPASSATTYRATLRVEGPGNLTTLVEGIGRTTEGVRLERQGPPRLERKAWPAPDEVALFVLKAAGSTAMGAFFRALFRAGARGGRYWINGQRVESEGDAISVMQWAQLSGDE